MAFEVKNIFTTLNKFCKSCNRQGHFTNNCRPVTFEYSTRYQLRYFQIENNEKIKQTKNRVYFQIAPVKISWLWSLETYKIADPFHVPFFFTDLWNFLLLSINSECPPSKNNHYCKICSRFHAHPSPTTQSISVLQTT